MKEPSHQVWWPDAELRAVWLGLAGRQTDELEEALKDSLRAATRGEPDAWRGRVLERSHEESPQGVNVDYSLPVTDPVNHPKHYLQHPSGVECIEITQHMNFCLGNAVKYIWRADLKANAIQDLKKAAWYLEKEIERRYLNAGVQSVPEDPTA